MIEVAHRGYRTLKYSLIISLLSFVVLSCLVTFFIALIYPSLVIFMHELITPFFSTDGVNEVKTFLFDFTLARLNESSSSTPFILTVGILSLIGIGGIFRLNIPKPLAIWLIFSAAICLISSLFFLIIPDQFIHTTNDFITYYIQSNEVILLGLPLFLNLSFIPLPLSFFQKLVGNGIVLGYLLLLAVCRYIFFIFILEKVSYLFMPLFLLLFGPWIDVYIIVSLYGLLISLTSEKV